MPSVLVVLALVVALAAPASAQPAAPEACTYDTCALRVEPAFFGPQILRGAEGEPVGRLGLFGFDLSDAVGTSERAFAQARVYENTRLPAFVAALGASVLLGAAVAVSADASADPGVRFGTTVGGLALGALSVHLQFRSQRAASRAVWEYNRDLPR